VAVNTTGVLLSTPTGNLIVNQIFFDNFSSASNWTLNDGSGSNVWKIGANDSYPGGSCGAATSTVLNMSCPSFGDAPVYCTWLGTDRSSYTANNISTIGHTAIKLKFAWKSAGSSTAYGKVRYSIDGGSTWIELPTQYNGQSNWQCESIDLPASTENISNLRIGFRWINDVNLFSGQDPPFTITNVIVEGLMNSDAENVIELNQIHSIVTSSNSAS